MALVIFLLPLLVFCAAEAQSQGDGLSFPLITYNATIIDVEGPTCPNDQLRQEILQNITTDIRALLQQIQQCPCLSKGGTRVAYLDMTDPDQNCPTPWREITSPKRLCGRGTGSNGCFSVTYPVNGINYTQVCGRVTAYQCGQPDGFQGNNIDSTYLDGVSITHGNPRQHIWTFFAPSSIDNAESQCLCSTGGTNHAVAGYDYFCESASATMAQSNCANGAGVFTNNPLWDGSTCDPESECCDFNNPPWFCQELPQPTSDDIEVRICASREAGEEDSPIEQLEIYVS